MHRRHTETTRGPQHAASALPVLRQGADRLAGSDTERAVRPSPGTALPPLRHNGPRLWRWNWRLHGGFGRSFVLVEEVFPGEGAPLPTLLNALRDLGVGDWHHFYVQEGLAV